MAFLCPARRCRVKKKYGKREDAPLPGRITGSDSIDTLVRVGVEKERGPRARMVVIYDFSPCVDDELQVYRGQQVHVLYQENDWLYVITREGKEGFVPYNYCLPLERSVDDFALNRPAGKPSKSHASDNNNDGELHKTNSRSMPDIASIGNTSTNQSKNSSHTSDDKAKPKSGAGNKKAGKTKHKQTTGEENQGFASATDCSCQQGPDLLPHTSYSNKSHFHGNIVKPTAVKPSKGRQKERSDSFKRATQRNSLSPKESSTSTLIDQENARVESGGYLGKENGAPSKTNYTSYSDFDTIRTSDCLINTSSEHLLPGPIKPFHKKPQGRFIVLFSFNALEENDVTVNRGEFVTLLNKDDPDWFWVLRIDGHEGFVPSSFLCPAEGQVNLLATEMTSFNKYKPKPVKSSVENNYNGANKTLTKLGCLYDYVAEAADHLSVRRGDTLYADMQSQRNSEWLYVYSGAAGQSGYIPRSHAKPLNFGFSTIELNNTPLDPYISP